MDQLLGHSIIYRIAVGKVAGLSLHTGVGPSGIYPFVQAVRRNAQPLGYIRHRMTELDQVVHRFVLKFQAVSLLAHTTSSSARNY